MGYKEEIAVAICALDPDERMVELVRGLKDIGFERIILVDDVFTTGATVYECAKVLKQAGASKVYLSAVTSPAH